MTRKTRRPEIGAPGGDVQAVRKGPNAIVKRLARREAGRLTARVLWKWFR
jgi:hypothetical protein